MRISDWSSDVCSSDLARPAYRRGAGADRTLVRPVEPDRPHLGHAQQHGHAARTVQRSRRGDARDDPPPYPDRLRMSDAAVLAAPEDEARWQRLHPATLAPAVVALGPMSFIALPAVPTSQERLFGKECFRSFFFLFLPSS